MIEFVHIKLILFEINKVLIPSHVTKNISNFIVTAN
jgi:hypothetical protein